MSYLKIFKGSLIKLVEGLLELYELRDKEMFKNGLFLIQNGFFKSGGWFPEQLEIVARNKMVCFKCIELMPCV